MKGVITIKILNIEDDVFKHRDIYKVLNNCGIKEIDWAKTFDEGMKLIMENLSGANPYKFIITDMYYPRSEGLKEEEAGELLIQTLQKKKINIPVILCSSISYRYPEILGCIHYSDKEDWEGELRRMIEKLN